MAGSRVVQLTEDEKRARAREKVTAAARRGESPSVAFGSSDLQWAFAGREEEIQELEETAERSRVALREREATRNRSELLGRMTERILADQEQEARAARRRTAEAEARRRLGWD